MNVSTICLRSLLVAVPIVFFFSKTAVAQTIPVPWVAADIGGPVLSGASSASGGIFSVQSAGVDIWGTADQFRFIYQAVTGDVELVARVDSLSQVHDFTNAGVMIRAALTANSVHAYAAVTPTRGLWFRRRVATGGLSTALRGPVVAGPAWVRVVRRGTLVSTYSSTNGSQWTALGSQSLALGATAYVGLAVNSHDATRRTSAAFSNVALTRISLPSGQRSTDIGEPSIPGAASYSNGVYTIRGAGADIWDTADEFHFVYQQLTGDGEVVARVASISGTHAWAKAGVMFRESLEADSRQAMALTSFSGGYAFHRRPEPARDSVHTSGGSGTAPVWLRLVRIGAQLTAYRSSDGARWTSMGSDTLFMGETVYVGLAVTSHNTAVATTAVIDNVRVTASGGTNRNPTVSLTSPQSGAEFAVPATMTITASATDPEGRLTSVEFYAGSTLIGSDTAAPYAASWSVSSPGAYMLMAVAHDADGGSSTSSAVNVTVQGANEMPTVNLTNPTAGATFTAPAIIPMTATASDPEHQLARVEFFSGTTRLGTDTTAPYSYSWTGVGAGTYSLTAVAYDAAGTGATSAVRTVTVTTGTAMPTPWRGIDIGSPILGGSSSYTSGVFSVGAAAHDIWYNADQFHFVYQQITGDADIRARVDSLTTAHAYTNAGVMIRGALTAGSIHAYTAATSDGGLWFRRRVVANGSTTAIRGANVAPPVWVRLVRQGSLVRSYSSMNGSTWTAIGSLTLPLGATAYVGLAVNSHNAASRTAARFSNVTVGQPTQNQNPTISLTSPTSGAQYTAPATISLTATALDPENQLGRVEFYSGTTLRATDSTTPYSYNWTGVAAGTYTVRAVAYDTGGASATSSSVTVTVNGATTGPPRVVAFTASTSHHTNVTNYVLKIFASGANPATATPIATSNLGKPTPAASGDITVNRETFFAALAAGSYQATVTAVGPGGETPSPAVAFTR